MPWICGSLEITSTAVAPVLVVLAVSLALAGLLILRGETWAAPAGIALGILAAAFCGAAIVSLATSGTFLGLAGGTEYWDTLHAWVTGDAAAGFVFLGAIWVAAGVSAASITRGRPD